MEVDALVTATPPRRSRTNTRDGPPQRSRSSDLV